MKIWNKIQVKFDYFFSLGLDKEKYRMISLFFVIIVSEHLLHMTIIFLLIVQQLI